MQAIKNKFNGKNKRRSMNNNQMVADQSFNAAPASATLDPNPSHVNGVVTSFNESHRDLPNGTHVDHFEKTEVDVLPSSTLPQQSFSLNQNSSSMDSSVPILPMSGNDSYLSRGLSSNLVLPLESSRTSQMLPVEVIEKPVVVHESIRMEQVEEVQPVVQVQREKTEIRQITQPLVDKEIKPVFIEERILPVEVLPTILREAGPIPERLDSSTRVFDATMRQVVEKAPIVQETEKWRIVEEVQPIIYREVIVPHVIRTSRPMREVIVEAPIFTEQVYASRQLSIAERERWSTFFTRDFARESAPIMSAPIMSAVPIRSIPDVSSVQFAPVVAPARFTEIKETLEETTTTTTTNTVAPLIGSSRSSTSSTTSAPLVSQSFNAQPLGAQPVVLEKHHDVKVGPMGESIVRDSITTAQVLPTRAN